MPISMKRGRYPERLAGEGEGTIEDAGAMPESTVGSSVEAMGARIALEAGSKLRLG